MFFCAILTIVPTRFKKLPRVSILHRKRFYFSKYFLSLLIFCQIPHVKSNAKQKQRDQGFSMISLFIYHPESVQIWSFCLRISSCILAKIKICPFGGRQIQFCQLSLIPFFQFAINFYYTEYTSIIVFISRSFNSFFIYFFYCL